MLSPKGYPESTPRVPREGEGGGGRLTTHHASPNSRGRAVAGEAEVEAKKHGLRL